MSEISGYLTAREAAILLGISTVQIARYCKAGKLVAKRAGKMWLIEEASAKKFEPEPVGNPSFRQRPKAKSSASGRR